MKWLKSLLSYWKSWRLQRAFDKTTSRAFDKFLEDRPIAFTDKPGILPRIRQEKQEHETYKLGPHCTVTVMKEKGPEGKKELDLRLAALNATRESKRLKAIQAVEKVWLETKEDTVLTGETWDQKRVREAREKLQSTSEENDSGWMRLSSRVKKLWRDQ